MRAAVYEEFRGPIAVREVGDPSPTNGSVVLRVGATGVCRSDWHGWMGHDDDIELPHVPGHEIAGTVAAVGSDVKNWRVGDRVTLPFVGGCGDCEQCATGNHQICDFQFQPGFTHWGSYAEYVAIDFADINLVALPDEMDFVTAASLGCRFATSFRAVVAQGAVRPGQWVAVHGCGGVGLSAVMIASALGAKVVAIDIHQEALNLAVSMGAHISVDASSSASVEDEVIELTSGGVHVSIDALGSKETCHNSIANLRKRGRHVQVGLLAGTEYRPPLPMDLVIARELEIVGSHGMQAFEYGRMLDMITAKTLTPQQLVVQTIGLDQAATLLATENPAPIAGVTVIDDFSN